MTMQEVVKETKYFIQNYFNPVFNMKDTDTDFERWHELCCSFNENSFLQNLVLASIKACIVPGRNLGFGKHNYTPTYEDAKQIFGMCYKAAVSTDGLGIPYVRSQYSENPFALSLLDAFDEALNN